jgi:integrase
MSKKQQCTRNFQNEFANTDNLRQNASNQLYDFQKVSLSLSGYPEAVSMKLAVILETRRAKANGKFSVKIRFNFDNQAFYVNTGIDVPQENFLLGKIVGLPKSTMMNYIISQKLEYTQNVLEDLQMRGLLKTKFQTGTEIKRFIESGADGYDELDKVDRMKLHFKTYTENHLSKYTSKSSADQYRLMLKKVELYCEIQNLYISDINASWLKDFELFCLKSGMSVNGVGNYMRAIRTIFNDAIDREIISVDKYPFRRFKIKRAKTAHRNVTIQDLRYMLRLDYDVFMADLKTKAKKHTSVFPDVKRYVDLFFLSFFLAGMNIKDLLFLTKSDIRNNQISITRFKTGEPVIIRVEPEAWEIIKRYPGKKYLLDYLDEYSTDDYRSMERRMNSNLKLVLSFVTAYWCRHSWASIASRLDVSDPVIDLAQGRVPKGMASVYINRDIKKVTDANRKVIDYLFKEEKKKNTTQKTE